MDRRIVEVSQLNAYIKNTMDSDFLLQNIWVRGELSNFKLHYSGHMYMSLKDAEGVLRAVMFRGAAQTLRFVPENGMQVLCRGRVSVFPRDGAYQLYIEDMEPDGVGALTIAFEQMKARLEKEGLFAPERKKPIPKYPFCIGVATSATGAAVQDITNILTRRWPMAKIILHPVSVQGEGAAEEIAAAIVQFNLEKETDVLIVGRGGGSQEDLWAFNEEIVARAVAESSIPIISAVGHETDFTICDFVADLRAPTPSAAAELCVPDSGEVRAQLFSLGKRIASLLELSVSRRKEMLSSLSNRMRVQKNRLDDLEYTLDILTTRAVNSLSGKLDKEMMRIAENSAKLQVLSPLAVLARGYSVGMKKGKSIHSVEQISAGDILSLRFLDGSAECMVNDVERRTEE